MVTGVVRPEELVAGLGLGVLNKLLEGVAGAVLAAGGVALWITAPSAPKSVAVELGPGSVQLRGAF